MATGIKVEKIKEYKKLMFFMLLFFINIGVKELFRVFNQSNTAVYVIILFLSLLSIVIIYPKINKKYVHLYFISLLFYIFLIISSFSNNNTEYGLQKAYLGLLLPLTMFFIFSKKNWKTEEVLKFLVITILFLDFITILMKIRYGFWSRSVSFGFLGSITFGWLNGMAFLGTLLSTQKGIKKIFFSLFFLLMILWTGSKGPLVGLIIISTFLFYRYSRNKNKLLIFVLSILAIAIAYIIIIKYGENIRSVKMIIDFINSPDEYMEGVGQGSFGSRLENYKYSLTLFQNNILLGVGFGNWQGDYMNYLYPHNIILELLSEIGVIGIILFFGLLLLIKYKNPVSLIGLFGCVTLMFSGDFSYFRYAFYLLLIGHYLSLNENTLYTTIF